MTYISESIINAIKAFNVGNFISYDDEGNRSFKYSKVKSIFLTDHNALLIIGENKLFFFLMDDSLLKKKKDFFLKIKDIAKFHNKTFVFEILSRKFSPSEVTNIKENINNYKKKKNNVSVEKEDMIEKKNNNILKLLREDEIEKLDPTEKKWFEFLVNIYEYSSGNVFSKESLKKDQKEYKKFVEQAKRIAQKKVSLSKRFKPPKLEGKYSPDEETRRNQILYDYYSSLSQMLDTERDEIVGNVVSRLADHYFFKIGDMRTMYNENSPNFNALVKFVDYIGNIVGFKKADFVKKMEGGSKTLESSFNFNKIEKNLLEWFEKFKFEKIFLLEEKKEKTKTLKTHEKYSRKISESKDAHKSSSIEKASEKMLKNLEKSGSPRDIAFKKAIYYLTKGIDKKEAFYRAGLPFNQDTIRELQSWAKQLGIKIDDRKNVSSDKYEKMYLDLVKKGKISEVREKEKTIRHHKNNNGSKKKSVNTKMN